MKTLIILITIFFTTTTTAICQSIIISEIFPNPQGSDQGKEWIEIQNLKNTPLNLEKHQLHINNKKITLPKTIQAKEIKVIYPKTSLPNKNGTLTLKEEDQIIEQISYSSTEEGKSLSLISNQYLWTEPTKNQANPALLFHKGIFKNLINQHRLQITTKNPLLIKLIAEKEVKIITINQHIHKIKLLNYLKH